MHDLEPVIANAAERIAAASAVDAEAIAIAIAFASEQQRKTSAEAATHIADSLVVAAAELDRATAVAAEKATNELERQSRHTRHELDRGFTSLAGHLTQAREAAESYERRGAIRGWVAIAILLMILAAIWTAKGQI